MKNTILFLIILVLLTGGIYLYRRHPAQAPSISTTSDRITYPAGGEILNQGNTYTLNWNHTESTPTTTQIFLINTALEIEGASVSISDRLYDIPDTGSYAYTVPATLPDGTYKFEIGTLTSNTFQIRSNRSQ